MSSFSSGHRRLPRNAYLNLTQGISSVEINKIRNTSGGATGYQADWSGIGVDNSTGGLTYVSRDSVIPQREILTTVKIPLIGSTIHAASGGVISWVNPEPVAIIIARVLIDITTIATGACTFDIGTTTVSALTTSDNLIDGLDVNSATGLFDNITDKGTNGKSKQKLSTAKWVTLDEKTGDATGLVGNLYITYLVV